jgi:tRNA G26 N,N-dimethylase Trm1
MEQAVFESVRYSAMCQDCGAELECCGVQALVYGRLRWDVESTCQACGFAVAVCGGDLPSERQDQMLSEHGPARLQVVSPSAKSVVMMRVLRAELGIDLVNAKAVSRRVLSGDYSGTLPEMELLARQLRASGIAAIATRS